MMTGRGGVTVAYDGDGNRVSETAGGVTTKYLVDDRNPTGLPQVLDELVGAQIATAYTDLSETCFFERERVARRLGRSEGLRLLVP